MLILCTPQKVGTQKNSESVSLKPLGHCLIFALPVDLIIQRRIELQHTA